MYPYNSTIVLLLPLCCASSSLWWSPSFSFCFFVLFHASRGLLHSPRDLLHSLGGSWFFFFMVAILLLPSLPARLWFFFFLFPVSFHSVGASYSSFVGGGCCWYWFDVVVWSNITNKNDIVMEKPYRDHQFVWVIWIGNPYVSYGLMIRMVFFLFFC